MPQTLHRPRREVAPLSHRVWADQREDGYAKLQQQFQVWMGDIGDSEELFKKHVYENPGFHHGDARQHRQMLYWLLSEGEGLAVEFEVLKGIDTSNFVNLIDQKLDELRKTLHEWHGSIESQEDIPESFKKGLQDYEQGKIVDMETTLNSAPPSGGI